MSEDQSTCTECGRTILVLTAEENGGRCMPCATGTRAQIDAGRKRYYEDKAFRAGPQWQFWVTLSARPFETLSATEKNYLSAGIVRGDVLNGGFDSFFRSSSAELVRCALRGLGEIGAVKAQAVLKEATAQLPLLPPMPEAWRQGAVWARLRDAGVAQRLEALDQRFWAEAEEIWDRLMQYGARQGFFPPLSPS